MSAAKDASKARIKSLRRIAKDAQRTYVGRHWPTMEDMRYDGIGHGLIEDAAHERLIRRFIYEFQPEFVLAMLDEWEAALTPEPAA